jgi:hypothetical protein
MELLPFLLSALALFGLVAALAGAESRDGFQNDDAR